MKIYLKNGKKIRIPKKEGETLMERLYNATKEDMEGGYIRVRLGGCYLRLFLISEIVAIS